MTGIELLNVGQAARRLGTDERTIGRWIGAGVIRAIADGKEKLIRLDDLQTVMRARHQYGRRWMRRLLEEIRHAEDA